jgi:hypothetical protein
VVEDRSSQPLRLLWRQGHFILFAVSGQWSDGTTQLGTECRNQELTSALS